MTVKSLTIFALLALSLFVADRLVRIENQRYALMLRMCEKPIVPNSNVVVQDAKCLGTVQTRTSWFWHLFYALTDDV
ncbi:hypothetical protein BB934_07350 [Microvirga ossetica]|uniref:Uncharacterized protein n=1 Tax=Microvirga ossetica TaxID=1882682 RepID=A0A1B2EDX0_9HYPH|nr:hypothetical protein BB934_07350 [Microvirga ossetica]